MKDSVITVTISGPIASGKSLLYRLILEHISKIATVIEESPREESCNIEMPLYGIIKKIRIQTEQSQ